jgi:hypothetical protein
MLVKTAVLGVLVIFLTASAAWPFGAGAGTAVSIDVLMPSPPQGLKAIAGNGMATVDFTPPKSEGDSPVLYYTVRSHPGRITAKGTKSPIVMKGLTNGTAYTFTVTATNSIGTGLPSSPSNSVTPGEK